MQNEEEADSLKRTPPKQPRIYTTLADYREQRPGAPLGTWWLNPTEAPQTAPMFVGPREGLDPRTRREHLTWDGFYIVTIEPGQTLELPSEWTDAIQTVRGGRVVAGLMPKALRVAAPGSGEADPPAPELHPALDDQRAAPARRRRKAGA